LDRIKVRRRGRRRRRQVKGRNDVDAVEGRSRGWSVIGHSVRRRRSTRVGHTFSPLQHTCSDIFISFQQRTFNTSAWTSRTHQEHLPLNSVSIQLSVFIYILSVSSRAFLVVFVVFECVNVFCVLLHFNQICRIILKSVASHSYAELRGNNMTRGAVKDKVKVKMTDVSRYFSEHRL